MSDSTAVSAQGATLGMASPGSPLVYDNIANFKSWGGFDGAANDIDRTHLGSAAEEVGKGIARFGSMSLDVDLNDAEASHQALFAAQAASGNNAKRYFLLTLPDTSSIAFAGFVKKVSRNGGVDKDVSGSVDIRITGALTITPAA